MIADLAAEKFVYFRLAGDDDWAQSWFNILCDQVLLLHDGQNAQFRMNRIYYHVAKALEQSEARMCDSCGYIENAGMYPDWENGMCPDCDPSILV